MKKNWSILIISLLILPAVSFAAITDVSLSGNTITVGGINLTVSGTAKLDSIAVSGSNLSVIMSKGASLTVISTDKRTFTVSPEQYASNFVCNTSQSELTVANDIWDTAVTITITPTTSTCSSGGGISGGSSGSSGGGGGGGGGVPASVYTVIPGTTSVPATTVAKPSAQAVSVSPVFSGAFKKGASNSDVKRLQILLNSDPDTRIANTGVGSPGSETNSYGSLTEKAVQKFQEKYGIAKKGDEGYGSVGPKTRAKMNEISGATPATPATPAIPTVSPAVPATPASTGATNTQTEALQSQIDAALEQVKLLQAQLQTAQ